MTTNKEEQPTKGKRKEKQNTPHSPKGRISTLLEYIGYQKTMNAEPSHKKWEAKNNHRNTVDNKKK